jgi:hypothetical protein
MSTRINVTVGDGGLLDRNAQQTAANRQARVLADRRAAAEAEGVERRAADRIAAGLDPLTGLPASSPSSASTINRLDQEPAANRRGGLAALLAGPFVYRDYGGSFSGLTVRCRDNRNVPGSRYEFRPEAVIDFEGGGSATQLLLDQGFPEGVQVVGPTATTFALEPPLPEEQPETVTFSGIVLGDNGPVPQGSTFSWENMAQEMPAESTTRIYYAVQQNAYDTVVIQDPSLPVPVGTLSLDGEVVPFERFKPLAAVKTFTAEAVVRLPQDAFDDGPNTQYFGLLGTNAGFPALLASTNISFNGFNIGLNIVQLWSLDKVFGVSLTLPTDLAGLQITVREARRTNPFAVNCSISGLGFTTSTGQPVSSILGSATIYNLPAAEPGDYVHVAVTRYNTENGYRWNFYLNGQAVETGIAEPETWESTDGQRPFYSRVAFGTLRGDGGGKILTVPALHACRFTSRVLYTEPFTPPPFITRFA